MDENKNTSQILRDISNPDIPKAGTQQVEIEQKKQADDQAREERFRRTRRIIEEKNPFK